MASATAGAAGPPAVSQACVFSAAEASALLGLPVTVARNGADVTATFCEYDTSPEIDSAGNAHSVMIQVTAPGMAADTPQTAADCADLVGPQDIALPVGVCAVAQAPLETGGAQSGVFWTKDQRYSLAVTDTTGESAGQAARKMADALQLMAKRLGIG